MNEKKALKRQLEDIEAHEAFDDLHGFRDPSLWKTMSGDERELLGILFLKQAEKQMEMGDCNVLNSLHMAVRVAPQSAKVHLRQGLVFLTQDQNVRCLIEATKSLKKALKIQNDLPEGWMALANAFVKLGILNDDPQSIFDATKVFEESETCIQNTVKDPKTLTTFYWNWGIACYLSGQRSEEASDFVLAQSKLRKAESYSQEHGELYFDLGKVYIELAILIKRPDYIAEAIKCFQEAMMLNPGSYALIRALGSAHQSLFEHRHDAETYNAAKHYFEQAAQIKPDDAMLWLQWGALEGLLGKLVGDTTYLYSAHEKLLRAISMEPHFALIASKLAEVELLLGHKTENLDYLQQAKSRIIDCAENDPDCAFFWHLYGMSSYYLGKYFSLDFHYHDAINKFNHALSISSNFIPAWQGKALATYALADIKMDPIIYDRSLRIYAKAFELGANSPEFLHDWGFSLLRQAEQTRDIKLLEMAIEKMELAIANKTLDGASFAPDYEWIFNLGCAYDYFAEITGDINYIEKAITMLEHVVQHAPQLSNARYNLALAHAHLGEVTNDVNILRQSLDHFELFLQQNPEDDAAWNDCGLMLMDLAHLMVDPTISQECKDLLKEAEQKLYQAIGLGCLDALYNMACVQSMLENTDSAIYYLQRAEAAHRLPHSEDLLLEPWLENMKGIPAYLEFIAHIQSKE